MCSLLFFRNVIIRDFTVLRNIYIYICKKLFKPNAGLEKKERFLQWKNNFYLKDKPDTIYLEEIIESHQQCLKKKRHRNQITKKCRKRKGLKKNDVQKEVCSANELEEHDEKMQNMYRNKQFSHGKNPSLIHYSAKVKSRKFSKGNVKRKKQNKKPLVDLKEKQIKTTKSSYLYDGQNIDVYWKNSYSKEDRNNSVPQYVKQLVCDKKSKHQNLCAKTDITVSSVENRSYNMFKNNKKQYKYHRNYWLFLKSIKEVILVC